LTMGKTVCYKLRFNYCHLLKSWGRGNQKLLEVS